MKNIKAWFSKLKIKYKIVLSMYVIIIPISLFISSYIYVKSSKDVVENMSELYQNLVNTIDENINYLQSDVEDLLTYLCVNNDVRYILNEEEGSPSIAYPLVWEKNTPMDLVRDMMSIKSHIKTLILYSENGIRPFYLSRDNSVYNTDINEVHDTPIYQKAYEAQGDYVWSHVNKGDKNLFVVNKSDKIVASRVIFDYAKKKRLGYLGIGINVDKYIQLCKSGLYQENEGILVFNKNGEELVRFGEIDESAYDYIQGLDYKKIPKKEYLKYQNYYIFLSQDKEGSNYTCYMVPEENWLSQVKNAKILPILFGAVLLIGLWPLLMFASTVISKPLQRLYESMMKFKEGDFEQQVEVTLYDEIGEVSACFNTMVNDIKDLIDRNYVMVLREKQSEYDALQAQINPHFLYNTLDSLYWQALNGGSDELAEDILSLSQLFRLVLSQGESIIPVEQEVKLNYHYLQIQKMRFNKKLDYRIDIDEKILAYRIPKLILQPFVENAVIHGLECSGEMGFIEITGKLEETYLKFQIKDNGVGLTQDQINKIFSQDESKEYSSTRIGGYAIKNVKERLDLRYQGDFKLNIESKIGDGTTITILIPANVE
ncbi:MAG TPA: sensor histidine kinase [Epulopiscium sp.]|nr:sensor histidine kinase [Candidatus Epulonipiscium sp.]